MFPATSYLQEVIILVESLILLQNNFLHKEKYCGIDAVAWKHH